MCCWTRTRKPRLADFGQSRLTNEQTPSLGTLFYMAPEQADLKAVPDARWDVYALGAILYCMLVGKPPHMNEELLRRIEAAADLPSRLTCYRQWISGKKPPDEHRKVPGVDRALAWIVDRCLAARPSKRFANVQEVLDALRARDQARARRPLLVLGGLGPLLLLAVMAYGGWNVYQSALQSSDKAVTEKAYDSNAFAAQFVAASVATEIERYYRAVDHVAADAELRQRIAETTEQLQPMLARLADPQLPEDELQALRAEFERHPVRQALQQKVTSLMDDRPPEVASWFVCDERGTHLAGEFKPVTTSTVGVNFANRTYCYGGLRDIEDPQGSPDAGPARAAHESLGTVLQPRHEALEDCRVHTAVPQRRSDTAAGRPGAHPRRRRLHDVSPKRTSNLLCWSMGGITGIKACSSITRGSRKATANGRD